MIPQMNGNYWDQFQPVNATSPPPTGGVNASGIPNDPSLPSGGPQRQTTDPTAPGYDPGVAGRRTDMPIPAPPSAPGASGGSVTMQQFNQAWQSSPYPGTVDGLKQFYAAHPEYAAAGIILGGSKGDKVYGPGNQYWGDAVIGAGTPGGGTGKSGLNGDPGGGAGGNTLGSLGYGSAMAPFVPPTAEDALNDPGVKFGMAEANRLRMIGPAAHGTILNGRVLAGLDAANIGQGLQAYGQVYDRSFQTQTRNQDAPFDKNYRLATLGKPS